MNREGHDQVKFFVGQEVERTPAFGYRTLFVVGIQSITEIQDWLDDFNSYEDQSKHIKHIFFGANHSFYPDPDDYLAWQRWESMITHFLDRGYLCSLDIPIKCVESFNDSGLCEHRKFIPQIRVSIPYISLWNYNTMLKIDDRDFDATNPGVWTHSLHSLMSRRTFTSWDQYSEDHTL
jgi:hypothetical protein